MRETVFLVYFRDPFSRGLELDFIESDDIQIPATAVRRGLKSDSSRLFMLDFALDDIKGAPTDFNNRISQNALVSDRNTMSQFKRVRFFVEFSHHVMHTIRLYILFRVQSGLGVNTYRDHF